MKKTIFVLPLCLFFAFCSSSRKAVTPAGPGISNVNVSRADTMTSAAKASASFTPDQHDWAYKSNRDTSLNGTWVLDGMLAANGSWSNTSGWYQDSTASAANTSTTDSSMNSMNMGNNAMGQSANTTTGKRTNVRTRRNNRRALYDTAKARLSLNYKDTTVLDTTIAPYQYWKRIPTLNINASRLVFTGTTGCNSMSGTFNFSDKNIQFGRNIVTSKMPCNEYDEASFLAALKKANSYTINGNMLEIRQGNTLLLTFKKSS